MPSERVRVAKIGAAHGVRGEVRLFAYTQDPLAVRSYGELEDESGARRFRIVSLRAAKDHLVAQIEGVGDRDEAFPLPRGRGDPARHGGGPDSRETLGRKPAITGDVSRYDFPRSDLTVTLDGVTIKPSLALGGWIAFKPMHDGPMVMGDLVLLETGINPVMTKLIEGGTVDEAPAKQGTIVAITQGTAGAREPAKWKDRDS